MHARNALANLTPIQSLALPVELVLAIQQDATDIAYLTNMAQTTMRATSDDRTRRETRVKLDALSNAQAVASSTPSSAPVG